MPAVRIEDGAFGDLRYDTLAGLCGLADADHARGKMARLWRQCTAEGRHTLDSTEIETVLGINGVDALVTSRLADRTARGVRIRGTKGRIEWYEKLRDNGKKGGRPKGSKTKTKREPSGFQNQNPLAPALSPSPAPLPESGEERERVEPQAPAPEPVPRQATQQPAGGLSTGDGLEVRRRAIVARISRQHVGVYNAMLAELGIEARPMQPLGDPGERALLDLLRPMPSMEGVEEDCLHVLRVREAEARRTRSLQYLGASVWNPIAFGKAKTLTVKNAVDGPPPPQARQERQQPAPMPPVGHGPDPIVVPPEERAAAHAQLAEARRALLIFEDDDDGDDGPGH